PSPQTQRLPSHLTTFRSSAITSSSKSSMTSPRSKFSAGRKEPYTAAMGELGNYHQRRFEGMLNIPIIDDRLDIRFAGEWTKRQGYSFNETSGNRIDGRDLWSGRVTI